MSGRTRGAEPGAAASPERVAPDPAVAHGVETASGVLEVPAGVVIRPGTEVFWAALKQVLDPEFPVSVVDLGLIYDIRREGGRVDVDLTFTATACPCMEFIEEDVRDRLLAEPDIDEVELHVVWDPPWTRDRMTAAAREQLRRFGVAA